MGNAVWFWNGLNLCQYHEHGVHEGTDCKGRKIDETVVEERRNPDTTARYVPQDIPFGRLTGQKIL